MTELDFLLELLLNHKLQKSTQTAIKERIGVIQTQSMPRPIQRLNPIPVIGQAPSMAAKIQAMEEEQQNQPPPEAIAVIPGGTSGGTSPAAAQALQQRNELLQKALNGKPVEVNGRPRKF